jgi:uncharacterized protein (TIGR03578 family)
VKTCIRKPIIDGYGETKHGAFQQALNKMKAQISKENTDILLQIEPRDMQVLSASSTCYTERFLGFLFPRKRIRYDISVRITVKLRSVKLSEVVFVEKEEAISPLQRVLRMR